MFKPGFVADLAVRHGVVRNLRTHEERLWALKLDVEAEVADRLESIVECWKTASDMESRTRQAIVGAINRVRSERLAREGASGIEFSELVRTHALEYTDDVPNASIVRALEMVVEAVRRSMVIQVVRACRQLPEVGLMEGARGAAPVTRGWIEALEAMGTQSRVLRD